MLIEGFQLTNQALISVIIPVYNQEKWITRCLRSLENQSFSREKYELIVVNDGSTDNSESVINLFSNKITFINNTKNSGLPSALNQGIKLSKSKYIVRVDSDDYVNQDFLFLLYEFLEQNKYMDAVACDYLLVDDNEEIIVRKNCQTERLPEAEREGPKCQHCIGENMRSSKNQKKEEAWLWGKNSGQGAGSQALLAKKQGPAY